MCVTQLEHQFCNSLDLLFKLKCTVSNCCWRQNLRRKRLSCVYDVIACPGIRTYTLLDIPTSASYYYAVISPRTIPSMSCTCVRASLIKSRIYAWAHSLFSLRPLNSFSVHSITLPEENKFEVKLIYRIVTRQIRGCSLYCYIDVEQRKTSSPILDVFPFLLVHSSFSSPFLILLPSSFPPDVNEKRKGRKKNNVSTRVRPR